VPALPICRKPSCEVSSLCSARCSQIDLNRCWAAITQSRRDERRPSEDELDERRKYQKESHPVHRGPEYEQISRNFRQGLAWTTSRSIRCDRFDDQLPEAACSDQHSPCALIKIQFEGKRAYPKKLSGQQARQYQNFRGWLPTPPSLPFRFGLRLIHNVW